MILFNLILGAINTIIALINLGGAVKHENMAGLIYGLTACFSISMAVWCFYSAYKLMH